MSNPPRARRSRLAGAMASKGSIESAPDEMPRTPLVLAAEPTDPEPEPGEERAETAPTEPVDTAPVIEPEPDVEPEPAPEPTTEPEPVAVEPEPAKTTRKPPAQTARVLAGTGVVQTSSDVDLTHLTRLVASGRDQRRYVEDLPRRSDKGTYMRLPVHLQDVLAEYCDRTDAPMADFIAALLDSYFRDIGALPPLGEGNRPVEKFFEKMRKESRTYDY